MITKRLLRLLIAVAVTSFPVVSNGQTENPRGIYKMTTLIGKQGEIEAPIEQYKICTDSVTLTLNMRLIDFTILRNDSAVFNYTGEQPQSEEDKTARIYDSDSNHFTLKWWSTFQNHGFFPYNDWCIEKYEANRFSEYGRIAFDGLTATNKINEEEPLLGTWRVIGYLDNIRNIKKELQILHDEDNNLNIYTVFAHGIMASYKCEKLNYNVCNGHVIPIEYDGHKVYKIGKNIYQITWLSKDCIAIENKDVKKNREWEILERVNGEQSMLSRIASYFTSASDTEQLQ